MFCTEILFYIKNNLISVEYNIKRKLKLNNIKTAYNKSFKLKLKVIKLASVTLTKKPRHKIHILKLEQMACDFVKN